MVTFMDSVSQMHTQEPKQQKVPLAASEERYRTLVEFSPDAIFVYHLDQIVYVNLAGCRLLGASKPEQLLARSMLEFIDQNYHTLVQEQIIAVTNGEPIPPLEVRFIRFDGTEVDVEVIGMSFCTEAGISLQIIARDITARKQVEAKNARLLEEAQLQCAHLRVLNQRLSEIQENERKAMARELHDRVGQNLTALGIDLNIIKAQLPFDILLNNNLSTCLDEARALVVQTTELVRDVMADLYPSMLNDYGLLAALDWYGELISRRTGLVVVLETNVAEARLPETVEFTLFRIAQEAFNNVVKHAQATQVDVNLSVDNHVICLTIADNGRGLEAGRLKDGAVRPSWGLLTMSERADAIGGRCWLESEPGQGVTVIVEVANDNPNLFS